MGISPRKVPSSHHGIKPAWANCDNVWSVAPILVMIIDLVALGLTLGGVKGSFRFAFGVAFGLLVPGWSVVGLMKLGNPALEFSLSVGTSLALDMVGAQILMTAHWWNLTGLEIIMGALVFPLLVWQLSAFWKPKNTK